MVSASWGEQARGGNRFLAMNKRTGTIVWWGEISFPPRGTYYSVPVVVRIGGQELVISGGAVMVANALRQ